MAETAGAEEPENGRARATLRDVARRAGVSIATVSNVVNGKLDMMSPDTREAVLQAIREAGYRPSAVARGLRSSRRRLVGLILIDDNPSFLTDPFNTNMIAGLSNVLSARDYGVAVVGMSERAVEDSFLVRNHETDAIAVIPSGPPRRRRQICERLRALGQPLIVLQDDPALDESDVLVIRQDDDAGGRMLARRLIARGARRIAFLAPQRRWPAIEARLAGVRAAIAEARTGSKGGDGARSIDLALDEVTCGREGMADTAAALDRYAAEKGHPDTIMAGNDQMGIAALRWAAGRGIAVPGALRVTGFNAFDFREYSTPTLTSVRSRAYSIGEAAGEEILVRLAAGRFSRHNVVLPVEIVEGQSD